MDVAFIGMTVMSMLLFSCKFFAVTVIVDFPTFSALAYPSLTDTIEGSDDSH